MAIIGKVKELSRELNFEWEINDFFALPGEENKFYLSPSFSFAGESWHLCINPNGVSTSNSVGYIDLYLCRESSGSPIRLTWSWGLKTSDGKNQLEYRIAHIFDENDEYGAKKLWKRIALLENKSELVPSDILTIVFSIMHYSNSADDETEGLSSSLQKAQKTISDITHDNDVLNEKLTALENELISEKEAKENAQARLECAEDRVKLLEKTIKEICNNALTLLKEHKKVLKDFEALEERIHVKANEVESLKQKIKEDSENTMEMFLKHWECKHQNELLKYKTDFHKSQENFTAMVTEVVNLSSHLSQLQKSYEELRMKQWRIQEGGYRAAARTRLNPEFLKFL